MSNALSEFMNILVNGITTLGEGIAAGVIAMVTKLFLATDAQGAVTGLSIFGGVIGIFASISLAVGITTKVYLWVVSLGGRK